jgi:energy-coupling factor transporter ATP-binding protein EcfA2
MLERFESVNKVGLFEDYFHSSGCDLGEVTLIYGENGVGKSTLAAILDSLRERNAGEIIRRRSLPGDVAPTLAVRLSGKVYTFDGRLPEEDTENATDGDRARRAATSSGQTSCRDPAPSGARPVMSARGKTHA